MEQQHKIIPVPVCATVSRRTGEITFEYSDDYMTVVRFGQLMNRLGRTQDAYEAAKAKAEYTGGGTALRE